jgi:hypothetical protein
MLVVADVKKITSRSAQGNNRRKHAHASIMCMSECHVKRTAKVTKGGGMPIVNKGVATQTRPDKCVPSEKSSKGETAKQEKDEGGTHTSPREEHPIALYVSCARGKSE